MIEIKPDKQVEVPDAVVPILRKFADVMPPELPKKLPPRRQTDHQIELVPGSRAPAQAPYRMSPPELIELRKQLIELLDAGMIQPSKAPYGAPVLFQKKRDGSLQMCIDYRALNKVTIKNKYPIPLAAEFFDRLSKAEYFTKLDLRSGYWQVRVAEGDEAKTTCVTRYGSFEFLVMPFGLTNAPATFCNLMNDVLFDFLDTFVVVYLDDIVIYNPNLEDHLAHLEKVFDRLREHRLYVKMEKCEFAQAEIKFLGHMISKSLIRMDGAKVAAIRDWPAPTKVTELRSFLGLANYYRRFIKGYSKIACPLTDLLKKEKKREWDAECQAAFQKLKDAITSEPVLRLPDLELSFEVHTDASDRALGGVLVQEGHPVAFESRKLCAAKQRYNAHEKEMTAVIHCLETWKHYFMGTQLVVVTDNVANTFFKTQKKLTAKQARWQEFLADFDVVWVQRPGRHNQVTDALSRKEVTSYVSSLSRVVADFTVRVRQEGPQDSSYQKLVEQVLDGTTRRYWLENDLLYFRGGKLYVPSTKLRRELLKETHDTRWASHPGEERTLALLARSFHWPKMKEDVQAYVKTCHVCQVDKTERKKEAGLLQPLPIPEKPWQCVSMDFITGFPKVESFGSVLVVVDRFSKYAVFIPAPSECPAEEAARIFFSNVVKHFGMPEDIVSDRDSRFTGRFWVELFKMWGTKCKFSTVNHPQTDGQTERVNQVLEEYLCHYVTATQKNWLELLEPAQLSYNLHRSSATGLSPFEVAIGFQARTPDVLVTEQLGRSVSPAAYQFAKSRQEFLDEARDSLEKATRRMKKYADKGRRPLEFKEGEKVLLKLTPQIWLKIRNKQFQRELIPKYDGPFEIVKRIGNVAYKLKLPERLRLHPTFHVSFLKPYHENPSPDRVQVKRNPPMVRVEFSKEIASILQDRKMDNWKNKWTEYLVHWKGTPVSEASWERGATLWQFEDQILEYMRLKSMRTSTISSGGEFVSP